MARSRVVGVLVGLPVGLGLYALLLRSAEPPPTAPSDIEDAASVAESRFVRPRSAARTLPRGPRGSVEIQEWWAAQNGLALVRCDVSALLPDMHQVRAVAENAPEDAPELLTGTIEGGQLTLGVPPGTRAARVLAPDVGTVRVTWGGVERSQEQTCDAATWIRGFGGVHGTVVGEDREPVPGVEVFGCASHAISDDEGAFFMNLEAGTCELRTYLEQEGLRGSGPAIPLIVVEGTDQELELQAPSELVVYSTDELRALETELERLWSLQDNLEQSLRAAGVQSTGFDHVLRDSIAPLEEKLRSIQAQLGSEDTG